MRAGLMVLALVPVLAGVSGAQGVDELIAASRFEDALELTDDLAPPEAWRLRRRVLHHAGDLAGALAAGRRGLAEAPEDLELVLGTADVALALGDAAEAGELCERLQRGVARLPETAVRRAWWVAKSGEYEAHAQGLRTSLERQVAAGRRARAVASTALAAALAAMVTLGRGPKKVPP